MNADPRQTPVNGIKSPRAGMLFTGMPSGAIPGDFITAGPVVPFPGVPGSGPIVPGLYFLNIYNSGSISVVLVLMAQKGHEYTPII